MAAQKPEGGSQKPDEARQCGDGEPRGLRQAARPERSGGLAERVPFGRDDNNAGSRKSEVGSQTTEDAGEDAELAIKGEVAATREDAAPTAPDDEGFVWPEGTQAAPEFAEAGAAVTSEAASAPLPSLDELIKRIPADTRETLDDLFRVKFVGVRRVSASSLKS